MNPNQGKEQILFKTITGSHMFGMNRPDSDIDYSTVFIQPSRKMILNGTPTRGKFKQDENDEQFYEIGKLIALLKTGNVNALWIVTSPHIEREHSNSLKELRQVTIENLSKKTYYSLQGMCKNNIKDFIIRGDPQSAKYKKKLNVIGRNLQFGINLLLYEKPIFAPRYIKDFNELNDLMIQLKQAFNVSTLPDKIDPKPFDDYLVKWRLKKLQIDELI